MKEYLGRDTVRKKTENLFEKCSTEDFQELQKRLINLGYVQRGSDPVSAEFHHTGAGLLLDVEFDKNSGIHSYELLTTEEMKEKHRKFRW